MPVPEGVKNVTYISTGVQNFFKKKLKSYHVGILSSMIEDYQCWRISGNLDRSIENCPRGDKDTCMSLAVGDSCLQGLTIRL
jgi:hypothetical protein